MVKMSFNRVGDSRRQRGEGQRDRERGGLSGTLDVAKEVCKHEQYKIVYVYALEVSQRK